LKHEEEVQLRLFFEQKLNTMHHVNREITTKYKNMKLKYAEEQYKTEELTAKLTSVTQELQAMKDTNLQLSLDLKEVRTREAILIQDAEQLKAVLEEAIKAQLKTDKLYKDAMQDIEEVKTAKVKVEMEKYSL